MHQWKVTSFPYGALPVGKKYLVKATSWLQGKASVETCVNCASNKNLFLLLPLKIMEAQFWFRRWCTSTFPVCTAHSRTISHDSGLLTKARAGLTRSRETAGCFLDLHSGDKLNLLFPKEKNTREPNWKSGDLLCGQADHSLTRCWLC